MTFNPSVPVATEAPNLFPAQNSANFTQLRKIIAADHQFNNTAQNTDGFHNQCTMIVRSTPGSVPTGANGVFYSALDSNNVAQIYWYNGTNYQLTPAPEIFPIRVVGSQTINNSTPVTIFANPGYLYAGTGFSIYEGTTTFAFHDFIIGSSGTGDIHRIDDHGSDFPTLDYSSRDLQITNNSGVSKVCVWSLIINRIS